MFSASSVSSSELAFHQCGLFRSSSTNRIVRYARELIELAIGTSRVYIGRCLGCQIDRLRSQYLPYKHR